MSNPTSDELLSRILARPPVVPHAEWKKQQQQSEDIEPVFVEPRPRIELDGTWGLDANEIAKALGARHEKVRDAIQRELPNLLNFKAAPVRVASNINGLEYDSYVLETRAAKFIVARYGNELGAAYLKYLLELEEKWETMERNLEDPDVAIKYAHALIGRAEAVRSYRAERDKVLHMTKSLTTSQVRNGVITKSNNKLVEEVNDLKNTLGDGKNYKSVIAFVNKYSKIYPHLKQINTSSFGKQITKISKELDIPIKKIPDAKYGELNGYHYKAWEVFAERNGIDLKSV